MRTVTIKELRENLSQIVEEAAIVEREFTITKFGKPKAKIIPFRKPSKKITKKIDFGKLPAYGIWKDREDMRDSAAWVRRLREDEERRALR